MFIDVDCDRVVPNISVPTVVADEFEYVKYFIDNVVPAEIISPTIPSSMFEFRK